MTMIDSETMIVVSTGQHPVDGFRFVAVPLLPQCVERFHRYRSNKNNIMASLSNLEDIFITIKSCLGIFLVSF